MWVRGLATLVVTLSLVGCAGGGTYLEDIPGYEEAHAQAALDCTGSGSGLDALAVYRTTCVEQETRRALVAAGHREAEHVPWQKGG